MEVLKTAADRFANVAVNYGCGSSAGAGRPTGQGYGRGSSAVAGSMTYGGDAGFGHGFGSGRDDGSGYGSGCGYDCGVASFCGQRVYQIDGFFTLIDCVHGNAVKGRILRDDLTTDDCYIVKQGSLFAHGKTLRKAMNALRDKLFDNMPEEERIAEFVKTHEWGKQYPSVDYYEWHHRLTGSCDMGRSEFAKRHGYKLTNDELLTVEEFIKLTENSYGGSVIRKLREAYKEE